MKSQVWRWGLGLIYIVAVASIWIAASFVVQSVVDAGVSPFLITYICNSLFMVYLPMAEIGRYLEDRRAKNKKDIVVPKLDISEEVVLLGEDNRDNGSILSGSTSVSGQKLGFKFDETESGLAVEVGGRLNVSEDAHHGVDGNGRWTRMRTAKVSLLICPFWFFAQLTFNLSLKYTTVTSNTILSTSSSLFTFLAALAFLGEIFTWIKLIGVLLCMGGTIIVSLGDSKSGSSAIATNPLLGDILAFVSAGFYAVYVTLVRKKLPDDESEKVGKASMAEFLGYLGLFNLLIFLPVALVLNLTKLEPFHVLTWTQLGLIIGKGLLDNVLSDYLWAKAVLMTSTTVATAGLSIQVPLAAIVDSLTGNAPHLMDYLGALSVMVGFAGINVPSDACCSLNDTSPDREEVNVIMMVEDENLPVSTDVA